MPPKKKTTTTKVAAKTSATKKTTATKAKVAKVKAPVKKATVKKKPVVKAKKATTKMHSLKSQTKAISAVSYNDWENVVKASFKAFPKLWWRVGLVNVTSLILILLCFALSAGVTLFGFGGLENFEGFIANIKFGIGYDPLSLIAIGVGSFVFFNLMIVVGVLGKVANFLVVKNYINGESKNPLIIYFKDTWAYFWRYVLLGFRVAWYILWPLLVFMVVLLGMGLVSNSFDLPLGFMIPLAILLILGIIGYTIYRSIQMFFYQGVLVHSDANSKESFDLTLSLVKNHWWQIFLSVFVFFALAWAIQMLLNVPSIVVEFIPVSDILVVGSSLLDFIFSFFILAPISVTFMYFLMLQVAKNKNIEL